ncbi:Gfo/Idh/MocA family protein [Parafilimonas sp.]|uniref:Gfo/Idh/MocA family protein n=1 Tax=Parafilimonas sp. TaxID=1969739 RepID=UPI0039E4DF00
MIRWGILGCGRIAGKFASDLKLAENAVLVACGARNEASADAFAKAFNIKNKHYSYEALVKDNEVDVIYIATPHSHHYEHTLLCINNGKAVLCEKAFAINYKQAKEMIDAAREKKVFLMEAVWTKFLPPFSRVKQMIGEGMIGDIKSLLVNFGFKAPPDAPQRLLDPALGGGTILDIGIYNVFAALFFLGKPDVITATAILTKDNTDAQCAVTFKYNDGKLAQLFSTFLSDCSTEADICGSNGRIRLTSRYYTPFATIEYYPGRMDTKQIIDIGKPEEGFGYQYEARHVGECLEKGLTESPVMPHADSLLLMETLDAIRKKAGIIYASD